MILNDILLAFMTVIGISITVVGFVKLAFVPFAIVFEIVDARKRRVEARRQLIYPNVSIVIPGYNESRVIKNCVESIMASSYPNIEVVMVDDGSKDNTYRIMLEIAERYPNAHAFTQENGGKGSALNHGIGQASGEIILLVDSDGVFRRNTIKEIIRPFSNPRVGAVCGDDRPVNLNRIQTRFLAIIGHVGTGLMRRAFSLMRCLPIVSGNIGAFRKNVLVETGGLVEGTLGEDLDLTWRVQRAGHQVAFAPRAVVLAESPSTISGLWRQRVRWGRGLLQTVRAHSDLIGNPRYGIFGISLIPLLVAGIVVPLLQIVSIPLLAGVLMAGTWDALPADALGWALWIGIPLSLALVVVACWMNSSLRDLRFWWTLPIWPVYSIMMSLVFIASLIAELRGSPRNWHKLNRTAVVSADALRARR